MLAVNTENRIMKGRGMTKKYVRDADVYRDVTGRSDVEEALKQVGRTDERAARASENRISLLRQIEDLREAVRAKRVVKQATATHLRAEGAERSGLVPAPVLRIAVPRSKAGPAYALRAPFAAAG
jgi:hypothetical protein